MDKLQQALNKAKIALMQRPDSAFFTTVCFSLKHIWTDKVKTACTDGASIEFNPEFFMSLTQEERVFLLIHESMHVAYLHMDRLHDREPQKWNIAADHVINLQLLERGFKMPSMGLADPKYKGMSTEEVYKLLPDPVGEPKDMDLKMSDLPSEELQGAVQDILVRAQIQSKMQGEGIGAIPGEIQIFLNKLLDPKLPWHRILQKYLQSMAKNDYSFRRPNRRFFPKYHLPSLYSESLMDIAIAVDTSGSVSDSDFKSIVSEVTGILRTMRPKNISLIQFDYTLKSVDKVSSLQELSKVTFTGRGGTQLLPVLEWANENKPQLLLIFSDGEFSLPGLETKMPTIWLVHNNPRFKAPFGKIIEYSI